MNIQSELDLFLSSYSTAQQYLELDVELAPYFETLESYAIHYLETITHLDEDEKHTLHKAINEFLS